jgi:integrase
MASVRKSITSKGTTRWQAVWQEPAPGGKTQRRTRNFGSQKEAREHAQRQEREVERRGVGDPQKHSLERYLKRWLATLEERGEHSPTTLAAYREHVNRARQHIGHIALEKLSPADLDGLYGVLSRRGGVAKKANSDGSRDSRPLSARSVLHVHRVLHTALEQARKWKMIGENPARDATAPTPGRASPKAFTMTEVAALLDAAGNRENYIVLSVLLVTGIRRSELLGLALDAVDLDAGTLTIKRVVLDVDSAPLLRDVTKSESSARTLSIPPLLVDLLREQKANVLQAALAWESDRAAIPVLPSRW